MQFLQELGIKEQTIRKIKKNYDSSIIDILKMDSYNITQIINYLRTIGVKVIDDLLIHRIELFQIPQESLRRSIENYGITKFVYDLNSDLTIIDKI